MERYQEHAESGKAETITWRGKLDDAPDDVFDKLTIRLPVEERERLEGVLAEIDEAIERGLGEGSGSETQTPEEDPVSVWVDTDDREDRDYYRPPTEWERESVRLDYWLHEQRVSVRGNIHANVAAELRRQAGLLLKAADEVEKLAE